MSAVRMERASTIVMEPHADGSYHEHTIQGAYLWKCSECGLVWEKKWHAESCTQRSHVESFEQGPYGVQGVVNGQPVGNLYWYTRRAVRRDAK